jgi:hypothetical protein
LLFLRGLRAGLPAGARLYHRRDYAAGLLIENARGRRRTVWLALSIVANVGVLAAFKYYNFFAGNLNGLLHARVGGPPALPLLDVLLPIGCRSTRSRP